MFNHLYVATSTTDPTDEASFAAAQKLIAVAIANGTTSLITTEDRTTRVTTSAILRTAGAAQHTIVYSARLSRAKEPTVTNMLRNRNARIRYAPEETQGISYSSAMGKATYRAMTEPPGKVACVFILGADNRDLLTWQMKLAASKGKTVLAIPLGQAELPSLNVEGKPSGKWIQAQEEFGALGAWQWHVDGHWVKVDGQWKWSLKGAHAAEKTRVNYNKHKAPEDNPRDLDERMTPTATGEYATTTSPSDWDDTGKTFNPTVKHDPKVWNRRFY